jgi:replicative superfamily II helicase
LVIKSQNHQGFAGIIRPLQILQMVGRAGRPQFDRTATAVIMTTAEKKKFYDELTSGTRHQTYKTFLS